MTQAELSIEVRLFVEQHIETVEQLAIMALLERQASRLRSAAEIAAGVSLRVRLVESHLEHLVRHGILDVRLESDLMYRYSPATADMGRIVAIVSAAYRRRSDDLHAILTSRRCRPDAGDVRR